MVYLASLCSWSSCRLDLWPLSPLISPPRVGHRLGNLRYSEADVVTSGSGFSRHDTSRTFRFRNGQGSRESAAGELTASGNQVRMLFSTMVVEITLHKGLPVTTVPAQPQGWPPERTWTQTAELTPSGERMAWSLPLTGACDHHLLPHSGPGCAFSDTQ